MTCNCINEIEQLLPEHKLDISIMIRGNSLVAETYTGLDRRDNGRKETRSGKPRLFAHKFCPFFGVLYAPVAEPSEEGTVA